MGKVSNTELTKYLGTPTQVHTAGPANYMVVCAQERADLQVPYLNFCTFPSQLRVSRRAPRRVPLPRLLVTLEPCSNFIQ